MGVSMKIGGALMGAFKGKGNKTDDADVSSGDSRVGSEVGMEGLNLDRT
jgi:hypothetical protein